MRFQLTHPLPKTCYVAVSGGIDSMSVLHWLSRGSADRIKGVLHVNHNTGTFADIAEEKVVQYTADLGLPCEVFRLEEEPPPKVSKEAWWREQRYQLLGHVKPYNRKIVLAHQLDDCIEEALICVLKRGYIGSIPYKRGRFVRPFRNWARSDIVVYARDHNIPFIEDPSNADTRYLRNQIRHEVIPVLKKVSNLSTLAYRGMLATDKFFGLTKPKGD